MKTTRQRTGKKMRNKKKTQNKKNRNYTTYKKKRGNKAYISSLRIYFTRKPHNEDKRLGTGFIY